MFSKLFERKTDAAGPADSGSERQRSLLDMINPSASAAGQGGRSLLTTISKAEREAERQRQSSFSEAYRQPAYTPPRQTSYTQHDAGAYQPRQAGSSEARQLDLLADELDALQRKFQLGAAPSSAYGHHSPSYAGQGAEKFAHPAPTNASAGQTPARVPVPASVLSFDRIVGAVFGAWLPILICAAIGFGLAAAYALSLPNKYEAVAEILIEPRGVKVLNDSVAPSGLNSEATVAYAESQVRIIRSSSVTDPVVEDLDLVSDPEFNGNNDSWLTALLGGGVDDGDAVSQTKEYLYENFYATRINQTFTILIGMYAEDPAKAARVANAIARQYISEEAGAKSDLARDANESLTARLAELAAKLEKSQRAVEDHRKQFDLIDADGKLVNEVQLARLNEQLALAKVQTGDARTRAQLAAQADLADAISGTLPSAVTSPAINQLRVQYNRSKSQLDRMETKLGDRHPDKIAAKAELRSAREAIAQEIKRTVRAAQKDFDRATARQKDLQRQVNVLKASASNDSPAIVRLRELESIADADRRVYETVLLRSRENGRAG